MVKLQRSEALKTTAGLEYYLTIIIMSFNLAAESLYFTPVILYCYTTNTAKEKA